MTNPEENKNYFLKPKISTQSNLLEDFKENKKNV